jgi:uncharacterized protein
VDQNLPQAQFFLGQFYMYGNGVKKDYTKAEELFQMVAEQIFPRAYNGLGVLHYLGKGVKKDYFKSFELFQKAAEQVRLMLNIMLGCFTSWE